MYKHSDIYLLIRPLLIETMLIYIYLTTILQKEPPNSGSVLCTVQKILLVKLSKDVKYGSTSKANVH